MNNIHYYLLLFITFYLIFLLTYYIIMFHYDTLFCNTQWIFLNIHSTKVIGNLDPNLLRLKIYLVIHLIFINERRKLLM